MKYRYEAKDAQKISKFGIDLVVYDYEVPGANVVYVSVKEGHLEEFKSTKEHYMYYIVEGEGVFVLNDEKVEAKATDMIIVPPETRIHYFGKMEMVLTVTPAFDQENEVHIRNVDIEESPFKRSRNEV